MRLHWVIKLTNSILSSYRDSSRAIAEPMHPAPIITTSYTVSGDVLALRDLERGQVERVGHCEHLDWS